MSLRRDRIVPKTSRVHETMRVGDVDDPIARRRRMRVGLGRRDRVVVRRSDARARSTRRRGRRLAMASRGGISSEPTDDDVKTFHKVCAAASWEGLVENVKASANAGELTSGVLGAGYLVFSESKKRGESEETLAVMQSIIQVMTQALLTVGASPAQRAMDDMMGFDVREERKLVDRLEEAYNDGITSYDMAECLKSFIENLQVQEMSFELELARAREAKWDDQVAKLEKLAEERVEAQKRAMNMLKLMNIAPPDPPAPAQGVAGTSDADVSEDPSANPSPFEDQD